MRIVILMTISDCLYSLACRGIPHCAKCRNAMIPWLRKCEVCEKGWYRYKGTYDIKTKCIKKCPTGYAAKKAAKGSFCKKIRGWLPQCIQSHLRQNVFSPSLTSCGHSMTASGLVPACFFSFSWFVLCRLTVTY